MSPPSSAMDAFSEQQAQTPGAEPFAGAGAVNVAPLSFERLTKIRRSASLLPSFGEACQTMNTLPSSDAATEAPPSRWMVPSLTARCGANFPSSSRV